MKHSIRISLVLWLVSSAAAQTPPGQPEQKTLRVFDWKNVTLQPPVGQIFSTNGSSVLKIENTSNVPLTVSILTITNPSLTAKGDALLCEIKYDDVGSVSRIHDGRFYVPDFAGLTRLEYSKPEAAGGDETTNTARYDFGGTSNWKPYRFSMGDTSRKDLLMKVELKLHLPTNGTVYLRPISLLAAEESFTGWWSPQLSGLIGGIGGTVIGCLGGLIGFLVSKGKARNFVLAMVKCFIALGILSTTAGLVAAVLKQPYEVWYALLLPGVILVLVFSLNLHSIQRRYDELEIRRMTSMDATGG